MLPLLVLAENVLIVGLLVGGLLGMGLALWSRSVESRKRYACPSCGEKIGVELMEASRCSHCGAPLSMTKGAGGC